MNHNNRKASSYSSKVRAGLAPFKYDRESRRFNEGAWKNLNREEYKRNLRALERNT